MGKELLIAKDLKQYFPIGKDRFVRAVDGVNFSINEGEVMGLVGESGSGKSTIAYTVMGMYRQTDGEYLCSVTRSLMAINIVIRLFFIVISWQWI